MRYSTTRRDWPDGSATMQATVAYQGREYAAGGGSVDIAAGRIFAYWTETPDGPVATLWDGSVIGPLMIGRPYRVRDWSGRSHIRYPLRVAFAGAAWHGTGYGAGMYLKVKRCAR